MLKEHKINKKLKTDENDQIKEFQNALMNKEEKFND